jgi:hypothetical protein
MELTIAGKDWYFFRNEIVKTEMNVLDEPTTTIYRRDTLRKIQTVRNSSMSISGDKLIFYCCCMDCEEEIDYGLQEVYELGYVAEKSKISVWDILLPAYSALRALPRPIRNIILKQAIGYLWDL